MGKKKLDPDKLPKYVCMSHNEKGKGMTALRLRKGADDKLEYYRDAGIWSVGIIVREDGIYSSYPSMKLIHNVKLTEITEAEWRSDNEGYVDGVHAYDKAEEEEEEEMDNDNDIPF